MTSSNFFKKTIFLMILVLMFVIIFIAKASYNRVNYSVPTYNDAGDGTCYGDCNQCGTPCPGDPPIEGGFGFDIF